MSGAPVSEREGDLGNQKVLECSSGTLTPSGLAVTLLMNCIWRVFLHHHCRHHRLAPPIEQGAGTEHRHVKCVGLTLFGFSFFKMYIPLSPESPM